MLKVNELFSGIGSQTAALKRLGIQHEVVGISEIDKFAIQSYEAINGKTRNYGDISKAEKLDYADLWTYSFPCFVSNSLVLTQQGYKQIKNVKIGDYVLTHLNEWKKVLKIFDNGVKDVVKIKAMGVDEIRCTPNHKFYVRNKYYRWENKGKLTKEGWKKSTKTRCFSDPCWVEAKDLSENSYLGLAINKNETIPEWKGVTFNWSDGRKDRHKNELQPLMNNNDFWWLIGRYLGDGWKRTQGGITVCCAKSELFEITDVVDRLPFSYNIVKERTVFKIHIPIKELSLFCDQFGCGAENKKLTSTVLNLPVVLLEKFLEGYLSADGCYLKNGTIKASSVSRELIYGIGQCILKVYKRPYSIYKCKRRKTTVIQGRVVNQKDDYQVCFKKVSNRQDKAFYEDGYVWFPYINQTNAESENVYDIEVDGDHSFTVQNTIVHNCQDLSVAGKQKGIKEGTRSGLLLEVERLLLNAVKDGTAPKYLLLENVKNLVGKQFKPDFDKWLDTLDFLGYDNYWQVLNAKDYGIPQNRERVFVVSIRKDLKQSYKFPDKMELLFRLKDLLEPSVDEKYYLKGEKIERLLSNFIGLPTEQRLEAKFDGCTNTLTTVQKDIYVLQMVGLLDIKGNEQVRRVYDEEGLSPTLNTMQGGNRQPKIIQRPHDGFRIRKLTPLECWRLMGFTDEDFYKAQKSGVSNSQLYKQAGNSIVVDVLATIFNKLLIDNIVDEPILL